jgi:hypothetical protein
MEPRQDRLDKIGQVLEKSKMSCEMSTTCLEDISQLQKVLQPKSSPIYKKDNVSVEDERIP